MCPTLLNALEFIPLEYGFPSSLNAEERCYVHRLAMEMGLQSKSRGSGYQRWEFSWTRIMLSSKICCFFENLSVNYFTFTATHSAYKFSNKLRILGLYFRLRGFGLGYLENLFHDFLTKISIEICLLTGRLAVSVLGKLDEWFPGFIISVEIRFLALGLFQYFES